MIRTMSIVADKNNLQIVEKSKCVMILIFCDIYK